jgi:spermidine synthase
MTLQILLLLAFQSIYGYVYHQLAILIGLGMAGIAFGSWLGIRRIGSRNSLPHRSLASTQFLLALSAPALLVAVILLTGLAPTWLAGECAFPALAFLCGVLGGYQFPVATHIYLHEGGGRAGAGARLGTLYAIDLLGGCAGALLLSTYLIPVYGFWKTAWLSAAINLVPALLAARVNQREKSMRS